MGLGWRVRSSVFATLVMDGSVSPACWRSQFSRNQKFPNFCILSPMRTIHLAGIPITIQDRLVRQLCSWCGERLIDLDLEMVAVHEPDAKEGEPFKPSHWEVGAWVGVEGTNPRVYTLETPDDPNKYPDESCLSRDAPRAKPQLVNAEG